MNFYLNYLKIELKRAYKSFPKMLISASVLLIIMGTVAFCGEKILYANKPHDKARVAFVNEDSSKLVSMATILLKSSESISSLCEFVDADRETANSMIKCHDAIASIIIPDGFVSGLMHGLNVPITIQFSDTLPAVAALMKELSYTATRTMTCIQSGIYAQYDLYNEYNKNNLLDKANYELNEKYLSFIFSRNSIFKKVNVTTTGNISVKDHYIAGGLTLFFMLLSMSFVSFIMNDSKEFKNKLFKKTGICFYYINKILIIFSLYYIVYLMVSGISLWLINYNMFLLAAWMIPILISMATVTVFLYEISPNQLSGIILIFIFTLISSILSGCIIPPAYLPDTLKYIGNILPSTYIINVLSGVLGHSISPNTVLCMALSTIVYFVLTVIIEKKVRVN